LGYIQQIFIWKGNGLKKKNTQKQNNSVRKLLHKSKKPTNTRWVLRVVQIFYCYCKATLTQVSHAKSVDFAGSVGEHPFPTKKLLFDIF